MCIRDSFSARPPARTTVPGADWGRPDILIEIEAIAVRQQTVSYTHLTLPTSDLV